MYKRQVYTQLTDVETETNGLLTYDRKVLKVDLAALRRLNEELSYPGSSSIPGSNGGDLLS